jgi:hypothetical protein
VEAVFGRAVILQGNPAKVDEAIAFIRDQVSPLVNSLEGSHGLSMFANRETGQVVVSTSWADEAALVASDGQLGESRREGARILEAGEPRVEIYEPAVIFQNAPDQPGYWSRAVEAQHQPDRLEQSIAIFRDTAIPAMREHFAGINTAALLVNRKTGRSLASVTYTSREAMEASRDEADRMRSENLGRQGAELLTVMEMEVAIVGIRPPVDLPAQGRPVEFPANHAS